MSLGLNLDKNGQRLLQSFDACRNAKGERSKPPLKLCASTQTVCVRVGVRGACRRQASRSRSVSDRRREASRRDAP
jgi:hypothetical protein